LTAITPRKQSDGGDAPALRLRSLSGRYGTTLAVDAIDLDVAAGEFLTLLGPSGSGKTTMLRLIAGFLEPVSGTVEVAGRDITRIPSYHRDIGVVFQNYALFPHMTAGQNVVFPLQMRRVSKAEASARVHAAFSLVHLDGYEDRYPRQLSGGQQQRVALARALVFEPRVLLMDEPLGALDKKLRDQLQLEIKRIHEELKITVVYVTHDQEEALVLSDRVAIFNAGRIAQLGSARDIYQRPASLFVADFIGEANVLAGALRERDGHAWLETDAGNFRTPQPSETLGRAPALVIRPERLELLPASSDFADEAWNLARGNVKSVTYLGAVVKYAIQVGPSTLTARVEAPDESGIRALGDEVLLRWRVTDGVLVPGVTEAEGPR
jgi:putative spermidine/putrescine transport system ATP-binding protein